MKLAILTDSGANLSLEFVQKNPHLFMLPLMIIIDGKSYRDQVEISTSSVYAQLDDHHVSTSLPSREDIEAAIQQIKKEGYTDVLCMHISAALSGTFNFVRLVLEETKGIKIHFFDSKTVAGGLAQLIDYAVELNKANTSLPQIIKKLEEMRLQHTLSIFTTQTLKYLKRGGRIGRVEATIGDVLHIRPIISVDDDGVLKTLGKAFGLQRCLITMLKFLTEKFENRLIDLTIHFGSDSERANELKQRLEKALNIRQLNLTSLTPVLGVHTGPSLVAYCAREVLEA